MSKFFYQIIKKDLRNLQELNDNNIEEIYEIYLYFRHQLAPFFLCLFFSFSFYNLF